MLRAMHTNPAFRRAPDALALAMARDRGFGVLTLAGPEGPVASHVPFLLSADGTGAEMHLAQSNPILRTLAEPRAALLAVCGPDAYVSPDWYGLADQVPTWNYTAVHLRGLLRRAPDETLRGHVDRLSADFEARVPGKSPWTAAKMTPDALERFLRAIAPVTLAVERVEATVKLNQNKPDPARLAAADGVGGSAIGLGTAAMAAMMRDPPA